MFSSHPISIPVIPGLLWECSKQLDSPLPPSRGKLPKAEGGSLIGQRQELFRGFLGASEPTSTELACQCRPISTYVVVDTGRSGRSGAEGGTTSTGIASKFVDKHGVLHLGDCESRSDCWMGVQWACG